MLWCDIWTQADNIQHGVLLESHMQSLGSICQCHGKYIVCTCGQHSTSTPPNTQVPSISLNPRGQAMQDLMIGGLSQHPLSEMEIRLLIQDEGKTGGAEER